MKLEYLKGSDNKVADALSRAPEKLDKETVTELLNCAQFGNTPWAEADIIHVIVEGEPVDQQIIVWAAQIVKQHKKFCNLANSDWVKAQQRDPIIPRVIDWINWPKGDKRTLVEYLGRVASNYKKCFYAACQKEFTVQDNLLYMSGLPLPTARTWHQSLLSQLGTGKPLLMVVTIAWDTRAGTEP